MRKISGRLGVAAGLLWMLIGVTVWGNSGGSKPVTATAISSLPVEAQAGISAALGRDLFDYQVRQNGPRLEASSPKRKLTADFTATGVEVRSGGTLWKLALQGYGYGEALRPVTDAAPRGSANRVEYRRGALTEWYVNGPLGLEQGFTLSEPPRRGGAFGVRQLAAAFSQASLLAGEPDTNFREDDSASKLAGVKRQQAAALQTEPLTIALAISGDVTAKVDAGGSGLTLTGGAGQPELRYAGLTAHDATGKELPAWLEVRGDRLLLKADDAGARYPVVVDPVLQLAKLTASDGGVNNFLAQSVAIDGNTVVAGVYDNTMPQGAVYVFVKPATGWSNLTQTAKLTASDGRPDDLFGYSVAISGNTVVAGAAYATFGDSLFQGAIYVYVEPAGGWTNMTQTAKLTALDGYAGDLGNSVSISGNTVVAGAYNATIGPNIGQGAAYVFVKPAGGWRDDLPTAELTASDGASDAYLGASVSVSGTTVVAGAPANASGRGEGAAYVFVKPPGGWTNMTQTAKLTASDGAPNDDLGTAVGLSGNTAVVGSENATVNGNQFQGAAYMFVEPRNGWVDMTETAKLTSADGEPNDAFGHSVAISDNGVVAGAYYAAVGSNGEQGAAYVFSKPAGGWTTTSKFDAKLTASDGKALDHLGTSVAISRTTVVAGVPEATIGTNGNQGAAYVFGP